jgi:hypothetical protein
MPNEPESPKAPELDESKTSETAETKEMDRIANKAAGKALRTEERYDRDRSTFQRADLPEWHKSRSSPPALREAAGQNLRV